VLTLNALSATHEVFIPLQPHFLACTAGQAAGNDGTGREADQPGGESHRHPVVHARSDDETGPGSDRRLERLFGEEPRNERAVGLRRLFDTRIRRNIKLAEAPSFGQSIFGYAPTSNGAADYAALATKCLANDGVIV